MKKITIFILFTLVLLMNFAKAGIFEKCGVYEGQGYLLKKEKKIYFVLEKGSRSEILIELEKFNEKENKHLIETKVNMHFNIDKVCDYKCSSKKFKVINYLAPYLKPKSFVYPKPRPIVSEECK